MLHLYRPVGRIKVPASYKKEFVMKVKIGNRKSSCLAGFTLMEILMVVVIIGLLAAIGIPSFLNARQGAETNMKAVNVASVNAAKEQWAVINNKATGTAVVWTNIATYIGNSVTNQAGLNVGTNAITLNAVGVSASY
jgi:type IV pilus assembly protein PilA